MSDDLILTIPKGKRLKLSTNEIVTHYAVVGIFLIFPAISVYELCAMHIFHNYNGDDSGWLTCGMIIPFLLLAIFVFLVQNSALKFKEIRVKQSAEQFKEALELTAKQLGWQITSNEAGVVKAYRIPDFWDGSISEMITIIRTDNDILINSICNPDDSPMLTWFGQNRKNVKTFLQNLNDVITGVPVASKIPEKPDNEWSAGKVLSRIILYPLCIGLIALSVLLLIPSSKGASYGIVTTMLALTYLYTDIKMIITNKSRKSETSN